jgi:ABC-transporter N-terminal
MGVPTASDSPQVSVQAAKESFTHLERQLSRASTLRRSSDPKDPEKGESEEEAFNLREYLSSANAAQDEAGITNHHKRVGVTWNDLEVIVPGGGDFKVSHAMHQSPTSRSNHHPQRYMHKRLEVGFILTVALLY